MLTIVHAIGDIRVASSPSARELLTRVDTGHFFSCFSPAGCINFEASLASPFSQHIADVKTESGVVLEFQHSFLHRDERESRESFYQKMVWIVDGRRRARDREQFVASLGSATVVNLRPLTFSFPSNEGALLRDWAASRVKVFFDFGDLSEPRDTLGFDKPILWLLYPRSSNGRAYVMPVLETSFVPAYLKGQPLKGMDYSAAAHSQPFFFIQQASLSRWGFHPWLGSNKRGHALALSNDNNDPLIALSGHPAMCAARSLSGQSGH